MKDGAESAKPAAQKSASYGGELTYDRTFAFTEFRQRKSRRSPGRKALLLFFVVLVVAVVIAVLGIVPRLRARSKLQQQTDALAAPNVVVAKPQMGAPSQEVVLPGNIQAYIDSGIYARTDGYLKKWYFDIGAHVKKGQLLAVIESPEVDQQLAQAKADLATAQANAGQREDSGRRAIRICSRATPCPSRIRTTSPRRRRPRYAGEVGDRQCAAAGTAHGI